MKLSDSKGPLTDPFYWANKRTGRSMFRRIVDGWMNEYNLDAVVFPTKDVPAEPLPGTGEVVETGYDPTKRKKAANPRGLASFTGYPDISVPTGFTSAGVPICITFLGRAFSEPTLIKLAYSFEQATKHRRVPPTVPPLR